MLIIVVISQRLSGSRRAYITQADREELIMTKRINTRVTVADVRRAREAFEANEPRDLFYRTATELVSLARSNKISLTTAEALAILLQTWNKNFYRFKQHRFDARHFRDIENLLAKHNALLARCYRLKIENLNPKDEQTVRTLFQEFETILGPVGSAKSLHLLAPRLFPLWDREIARKYGVALNGVGSKVDKYWEFVLISKAQACGLLETGFDGNLLKALDEYNYCKHSKGWIE